MATSDLLKAIEGALGVALDLGYAAKAEQHDLFEAYVLILLLEAAKSMGWSLSLRDGTGATVTAPVFRRGPGRLPSPGFTFARMTKPGKEDLEAHLGVKVAGRTAVGVSAATMSAACFTSSISWFCRRPTRPRAAPRTRTRIMAWSSCMVR